MSKFKKGDKVQHIDYPENGVLIVGEVVMKWYSFENFRHTYYEDNLFLVEDSSTITKKHTYTGGWISIDEELPPFGVEVFLYLPEETPKRQKGRLKYIGEDGNIFASSHQPSPFATLSTFNRIKGKVKMWTLAPPLPEEAYNE